MKAGYRTDIGLKRKNNEDSYFADEKSGLFIVADGVGGQNSGEVASSVAVSEISGFITGQSNLEETDTHEIFKILGEAIFRANIEIIVQASSRPQNNNMATTAVIMRITGNKACIANVGDSRAYRYHDGDLVQLTDDHTVADDLIRSGKMTREEIEMLSLQPQPYSLFSTITRALGNWESSVPDYFEVEVHSGDYMMLCSDGLYGELTNEEIAAVLQDAEDPQQACDRLIEAANASGGADNITVILVEIGEEINE